MKIRKVHKGKRYRYSVNRKTLNKTRSSTGKIKDPVLKKLWIEGKRPATNFREMGLAADPNKAISMPSYKQERLKITKLVNGFVEEELDESEMPRKPKRGYVAEMLEEQAKLRPESQLRLPKGVVSNLSYFLNKYKFNYKAMVADRRNYDQWTWKQFRMKIRKFMSIPEQWNEYLIKQKLNPEEELNWTEYDSDSEWK